MVILLSGETDGNGFTDVDCNSLCWRFDRCKVMCGKIVNALTHSTKFPCVAAGYCPQMDDFGALPRCKFRFPSSCEPANICTFKFPRCQLSEGYKKWRHIDAVSGSLPPSLPPPPSLPLPLPPSLSPFISPFFLARCTVSFHTIFSFTLVTLATVAPRAMIKISSLHAISLRHSLLLVPVLRNLETHR